MSFRIVGIDENPLFSSVSSIMIFVRYVRTQVLALSQLKTKPKISEGGVPTPLGVGMYIRVRNSPLQQADMKVALP